MLRYIDLSTLCDITFVWFLASWFVTRHVLFIFVVIRSAWTDPKRLLTFEWAPERDFYLTSSARYIFISMLCALEVTRRCISLIRNELTVYRYCRLFGSGRSAVWHGESCVVEMRPMIAVTREGQSLHGYFIFRRIERCL
jgi:hypothetical protein